MEVLHQLLAGTFTADVHTRHHAEQALQEAESQPQFIQTMLQLVMSPEVQIPIRTSAAVYLKNRIVRGWDMLSDSDKEQFRPQLMVALASAPQAHRALLREMLTKVIGADFPQKWPQLLEQIKEMLASSHGEQVWAGLTTFMVLTRYFRYQTSQGLRGLEPILAEFWPAILHISETLVSQGNLSPESALMLYDFAKIYKFSTARSMPKILQLPEYAGRTVAVLLSILVANLPAEEWRAKKWAAYDLMRTHMAYIGSRSRLTEASQELSDFRKNYLACYTLEIINVTLQLLGGSASLPDVVVHHLVSFLDACVDLKVTWQILEPHLPGLIGQIAFRLLCPTENDIDLFDDDPTEYVHRCIDFTNDFSSPSNAAAGFLGTLVLKKKQAFEPAIQFMQSNLMELESGPSDLSNAIKLAGALRFMQTLAPALTRKSSPVRDEIESLLARWVIPQLSSVHGFLRSRACQVVNSLAEAPISDRSILQRIWEGVAQCFFDRENLPVQVDAALTLQALLLAHEDVRAAMESHVTDFVRVLLDLTKRIDLESLLGVLDELVNAYPEQIKPFAVELAANLRDKYLTLSAEISDQQDFDAIDDKISAGLGILKSLSGLNLSLENQHDLLVALSETVSPIFASTYHSMHLDFLPETLELHDNTIYSCKTVTPQYWEIFPSLIAVLQESNFDFIDDALPVLEGYTTYGVSGFDDKNLNLVLRGVVMAILGTQNATIDDKICALQLGTRLFETAAINIDSFAIPVLEVALQRLKWDADNLPQMNKRYVVHLVSLVLAILIKMPETVTFLDSHGAIPFLLSTWFSNLQHFTRVPDLKLVELACLSMLTIDQLKPQAPQLLSALCTVLEALPEALKRREELQKEMEDPHFDDFDFEDDWSEDEDDGVDEEEVARENDGFVVQGQSQMQQSSEPSGTQAQTDDSTEETVKPSVLSFFDNDFLREDVYSGSPLDSLDPWLALKQAFTSIQDSQPQYYGQLISVLSDHNRQVLESAIERIK